MNVLTTGNNTYLNMFHLATRKNTLAQVTQAKQTDTPLDVEQVKQSNQQLKDLARKTGADLYATQLNKQAFDTYLHSAQ